VTGELETFARHGATAGSGLPGCSHGDWHVLLTKSHQEKVLAKELRAYGIGCYLPLLRIVRIHSGRKVVVDCPVFSSYVFARGSQEDMYRADRTKRVARILRVTDPKKLERELVNIEFAISHSAKMEIFSFLKRGTQVTIRSGPLKGLEGVVEDQCRNRLILQVEMLSIAVSLEIDGSLLEPLEQAVA